MIAPLWSTLGLALSLIGVLLLFRFYRLRPATGDYIVTESPAKDSKDTLYSILGWVGLVFFILGTLCQMAGAW
jgi:hypothetical protein